MLLEFPRASSLPASLRPPKQTGTPNDVVVSVNDGVSDNLFYHTHLPTLTVAMKSFVIA